MDSPFRLIVILGLLVAFFLAIASLVESPPWILLVLLAIGLALLQRQVIRNESYWKELPLEGNRGGDEAIAPTDLKSQTLKSQTLESQTTKSKPAAPSQPHPPHNSPPDSPPDSPQDSPQSLPESNPSPQLELTYRGTHYQSCAPVDSVDGEAAEASEDCVSGHYRGGTWKTSRLGKQVFKNQTDS
ncbi:MAG: DUF4278 domain-containing protein [Oculatellaceae cyanobacterium Prado106]|jgi:hypothetical protein|nr:DUF4278 domain-containing protein [Oculatellaceae cyanobacterium Prado106]